MSDFYLIEREHFSYINNKMTSESKNCPPKAMCYLSPTPTDKCAYGDIPLGTMTALDGKQHTYCQKHYPESDANGHLVSPYPLATVQSVPCPTSLWFIGK